MQARLVRSRWRGAVAVAVAVIALAACGASDTILLDCLTLWVSNLLLRGPNPESTRGDVLSEARTLLELYQTSDASWIIVSNEVGLGVVPPTELGRVFADELGRVNQLVAAEADDVYFMAAGLPLKMKVGRGRCDRYARGGAG